MCFLGNGKRNGERGKFCLELILSSFGGHYSYCSFFCMLNERMETHSFIQQIFVEHLLGIRDCEVLRDRYTVSLALVYFRGVLENNINLCL